MQICEDWSQSATASERRGGFARCNVVGLMDDTVFAIIIFIARERVSAGMFTIVARQRPYRRLPGAKLNRQLLLQRAGSMSCLGRT